MIRSTQNTVIIRDYVESLYRHRGKLLLYNLAIILLTIGVLIVWPREYRSEAKLWIKIGRENSRLDPTASTGETISIQENDREDEIKSVIDIIGSRGVVEGTVDLLGPKVVLGDEPLPGATDKKSVNGLVKFAKGTIGSVTGLLKRIDPISDREEAIQEIGKHVLVSAERKSNVITVKYDTQSPELARAIVETLIEQYKATHARIHTTEGSRTFFGDQLDQLKSRVSKSADSLREAKDELGLASISGHQSMLESQMQSVGAARLEVARKLSELTAQADELKRQLKAQPAQTMSRERMVPNTGRDSIREQLYALQVERMQLEATLNDGNPRLEAIKKQEAEARKSLASQTTKERKEVTRSINTIHRDLSLDLAKVEASKRGMQAMLESLTKQHEEVLAAISKLNQSGVEIQQRERDVELAVNSYMGYAESLEDARVDEELSNNAFSNISIAQPATLQEKPISPNKLLVSILGLGAMMFGSLAIIAGTLMADNTVNRPDEVSRLMKAPVMVSVPDRREFRQLLN